MAKGTGGTRTSSLGSPRGLSTNSYGDTVTNFNRNYLFNNPTIREAIQKQYPSVSFGSSGDSLTIVGVDANTAGKVVDLIKKEREKMVETDVNAIRKATFKSESGGGNGTSLLQKRTQALFWRKNLSWVKYIGFL